MKIFKNYLYFIETELAEIEKNILTIPQEYIGLLFRKIHTHAQAPLHETLMLEELLDRIQTKKEYYQQKQHNSYDYHALKLAFAGIIALILFLSLIYFLYKYVYVAKKELMAQLMAEVKSYGIVIKECSKRVYRSTEYWLEIVDVERHLSTDEYSTAKSLIEQIYELHATLHKHTKLIIICIGAIGYTILHVIYSYIRIWWNPQYKEYYEKFCALEKQIQRKLDKMKKNLDSPHA